MKKKIKKKICIIGLGYVGLPLALEFSKKLFVVGFDISKSRIDQLKKNDDISREIERREIAKSKNILFSNKISDIKKCTIFIITVPTPVDSNNIPDLSFLKRASKLVGKVLKKKDTVIFESTVYPGATEEVCIPILEKYSKLNINSDFFVGYSPERINPGDKKRKINNISKVISGSNKEALSILYDLYKLIINKKIYKAQTIKIAEAAKVIENTQRDLNIALFNELSQLFSLLDIDTQSVIKAASTKWNFHKYSPGLVGGHCIGVDPYYLTHKAKQVGFFPQIILAGRGVNEGMAQYIASKTAKKLLEKEINPIKSKVLVIGITFKENCSDIRNSKVFDLIKQLQLFGMIVDIYDPIANLPTKIKNKYNFINNPRSGYYDVIIFAVPHNEILRLGYGKITSWAKKLRVILDLKSKFAINKSDIRM
jgi:UDP-N-acetyl-D-galactosamine dehydrogenase